MGRRVDLQKKLSRNMRLAIGSANRSSVQEVKAPRARNVTLGRRVPNIYPLDPKAPQGCEDFTECLDGTDTWAQRGTCCGRFAGDTVIWNTYCTLYTSDGAYRDTLSDLCRKMKSSATGNDVEVPGDIEPDLDKPGLQVACQNWCDNMRGSSSYPAWCEIHELKECAATASGAALGECCGKYFPAQSLEPKCEDFLGVNNCSSAYSALTHAACDSFCSVMNKNSLDYDVGCAIPKEVRDCVGDSASKIGKCCAQVPGALDAVDECSLGTKGGTGRPSLWDQCWSGNGDPSAQVCKDFCDNRPVLDSNSYSVSFCKAVRAAHAGCFSKSGGWTPSGTCCGLAGIAGNQACGFTIANPRTGGTSTSGLSKLCRDLRSLTNPTVPCGLEISKAVLEQHCTDYCDNVPDRWEAEWCDNEANAKYEACLYGVEPEDLRAETGYTPQDSEYDYLKGVGEELIRPWKTEAKCCGENPTSSRCRGWIKQCEEVFDPKFEDKRDQIEENDYRKTGYGEIDAEGLETAASFCKRICSNLEDEPGWCDNVPGSGLLAGEIAAIVLACFLFLAIAAIVVLVVLYLKKPGVGGAGQSESGAKAP